MIQKHIKPNDRVKEWKTQWGDQHQWKDSVDDALKTFEKTQTISPILLEWFDQNGKWIGIPWVNLDVDEEKLSNYTLPKNQREVTDEFGQTHLLTSYRYQYQECLELDYSSIGGSFEYYNYDPDKPWLDPKDQRRERSPNILNFPHLQSIKGNFLVQDSWELKAPKLQIIGSHFSFGGPNLNLPNLQHIGSAIDAKKAQCLIAPKLEIIEGMLAATEAQSFELPRLKECSYLLLPKANEKDLKAILKNFPLENLLFLLKNIEPRKEEAGKRVLPQKAQSNYPLRLITLVQKAIKHKEFEKIKTKVLGTEVTLYC